jgi:predicted methyltransferase
MSINIILFTRIQAMNDLSFVVSEIRRHFTSWMEHSTKSFDVKWVGEQLVLTTDSVDLIQLW